MSKHKVIEYNSTDYHEKKVPREIVAHAVRFMVDDSAFEVRLNDMSELEVRVVTLRSSKSALAIRPEVSNVVRLAMVRSEKPLQD